MNNSRRLLNGFAAILFSLSTAGVGTAFAQGDDAGWTQVGKGIYAPKMGETTGKHHQCGRIAEAAWRFDNAQNRTILWMGTSDGGLWKSQVDSEGGIYWWTPLTDNFPGPHTLGSFLVKRNDSNFILIGPGSFWGKGDGNIYRTHNQGADWHAHDLPVRSGLPRPQVVNRIVEDTSDRSGDTVLACTDRGIYRSTDFGANWLQVYGLANVTDLVQDRRNSNIWYAGAVADHFILRSTDAGVTWNSYAPGIHKIHGSVSAVELTVCDTDPDVLYALVIQGGSGGGTKGRLNGVYRSLDRAKNWTKIYNDNQAINHANQGFHARAIACDPTDPNHLIFGLQSMIETFSATIVTTASDWPGPVDGGHNDYNFILFRPNTSKVVTANDGGYYLYDPKTQTVDDFGNVLGIEALELKSKAQQGRVATSYSDPDEFAAGLQDNGVIRGDSSGDGALTLIANGDGGQVSIMPSVPNIIAVSGTEFNEGGHRALSFNFGLTWSNITFGLPTDPSNDYPTVLIDPTPGLPLPFIFSNSLDTLFGSGSYVYYKSLDPFIPWSEVSPIAAPGDINRVEHTTNENLHFIPVTMEGDNRLFAYIGPRSFLGFFTLVDISPPLGINAPAHPDARVNADRSRHQPDTLYYTTGTGRPSAAFFSLDGGAHWHNVTANLATGPAGPDFYKLVADPRNPARMFLATSDGVWRLDPADQLWHDFSSGLRLHEQVDDIVINSDNLDNPTLLVATRGRGFWKRTIR